MRDVRDLLSSESDRGCALWAAALVDEKFEELLRSVFVEDAKEIDNLLKGLGPLASFSSRSKLLYALGIFHKSEFTECKLVQKIRNEFAHRSTNLDFETAPISDWIDAIAENKPTISIQSRREQYIQSIIFLLERLQQRIDTMKPLVLNNLFNTVLEVEQLVIKKTNEG